MDLKGLRLLVADDTEANRLLVSAALRNNRCEIEYAHDGAQAVTLAQSREFDAILMDIQMPTMDGMEATRMIRRWELEQGRAPMPIIAMTVHAFTPDHQKFLDAGMNAVLVKPIQLAGFRKLIMQPRSD